jgi:hypothetical protein
MVAATMGCEHRQRGDVTAGSWIPRDPDGYPPFINFTVVISV